MSAVKASFFLKESVVKSLYRALHAKLLKQRYVCESVHVKRPGL